MLTLPTRPPPSPPGAGAARSRAGFSLIELVVAVATMAMVIGYTLVTFTLQHQTYVVVDQVSETQQNARAIATLLERDIRNAGFMVPSEAASCGVDNTTTPDTIFLSDTDAILPVDQLPATLAGQDLGASVSTAIASLDAGDSPTLTVDDVTIDGTDSYDTDADGVDDSDFQLNGGAILVDVANPQQGVACGFVTAVTATSVSVTFQTGLSGSTTVPAEFVLVPAHFWRVVDPGGGAPVELRRDGVLLAKDVEDLQFAWFYDDSPQDGQVDAGETRGVVGTAYNTTLVDGGDLREIRVNLVLRTRDDDPRNPTSAGTGQPTENRTAGSVAGDDGRRRRVHTATVRLRNLTL